MFADHRHEAHVNEIAAHFKQSYRKEDWARRNATKLYKAKEQSLKSALTYLSQVKRSEQFIRDPSGARKVQPLNLYFVVIDTLK